MQRVYPYIALGFRKCEGVQQVCKMAQRYSKWGGERRRPGGRHGNYGLQSIVPDIRSGAGVG